MAQSQHEQAALLQFNRNRKSILAELQHSHGLRFLGLGDTSAGRAKSVPHANCHHCGGRRQIPERQFRAGQLHRPIHGSYKHKQQFSTAVWLRDFAFNG